MTRIYYSADFTSSDYAFDTTRKAKWIADSLDAAPIAGIQLSEPTSLTEAQLRGIHTPEYIDAVRTGKPTGLAESQGFTWDSKLWPMSLACSGGVVAAALTALSDGVSGAICNGFHHARANEGAGFCTFNGLVIAARAALAAGAKSVLILDLDAHCGGGTASMIADDPRIWQVDVSVSSYDRYKTSERARLSIVQDADEYLPEIGRLLTELDDEASEFDLCIYNAGMDPHEGCTIGGLRGITKEVLAERENHVFEWCSRRSLPIAFVPAGGYASFDLDEAALVGLHRLTLEQAAAWRPLPVMR
jgi:acetoin utilization deacetylase AcuC-like enzyme